ncbi:hypothetical protein QUA35_17870 [Microcoleus sp. N9_B2]|uniref:hypothetical protein n=1 Tax=unclassified Microcoleus TaxID=2642155 RepID=UPI002FD3FBA6
MNSLLLISPYKAWGFKPILSGKGGADHCLETWGFQKGDRGEIGEKGSLGPSAGIFLFECLFCSASKFVLRELSVLML